MLTTTECTEVDGVFDMTVSGVWDWDWDWIELDQVLKGCTIGGTTWAVRWATFYSTVLILDCQERHHHHHHHLCENGWEKFHSSWQQEKQN